MSSKIDNTERDILQAMLAHGHIMPGSTASDILEQKYPEEEAIEQVTCILHYLVEERYILPYRNSKGEIITSPTARAITPRGAQRLKDLKHPVREWTKRNWFGVAVVSVNAIVSTVASVTASLVV